MGEGISISPVLNSAGTDALHSALEQEIKARMAWPADGKEGKRGEQYQKVSRELNEALPEKVIAY